MAKGSPKSPLRIPFRAAIEAGYAHLQKKAQFNERIQALGRPSIENVKVLCQLGNELLEDLEHSEQRSAEIQILAQHWQRLADEAHGLVFPREILDHISIQLLLYHLRDSIIDNASDLKKAIAADPARQQYEAEMRDFTSLVGDLWDHKVNVTRVFALTISDNQIRMVQHWHDWMDIHHLLRKTAISYKRRYVSLKNESSCLLANEAKTVLIDECNRVCQLCDNLTNAELVKRYDEVYRHNQPLRSNSQVWNPLLNELEKLLSASFQPKRNWYSPGGFKQTATASRVYQVINLILHFCYPSIWSYEPCTTAAIKSRCHRYSAS
jgi:hypothetical protein